MKYALTFTNKNDYMLIKGFADLLIEKPGKHRPYVVLYRSPLQPLLTISNMKPSVTGPMYDAVEPLWPFK